MGNLQPTEMVTNPVRLSFVHVFEKYGDEQKGEPKYSVTLLIPKNDTGTLQRMFAAYAEAVKQGADAKGKWKGKPPVGIENPIFDPAINPCTPIWDGDGLKKNREPFGPEAHNCYVVTASDKNTRPEIVDGANNPIISAFGPDGRPTVYSGCYGRAYIAFFAYDNQTKGIGCALRAIQKTNDGEPLAAQRLSSDEAFGPAATAAPRPAFAAPQAAYAAPQGYATAPQPGYAPQQPAYGAPAPQAAYGQPQGYAAPPAAYPTPGGYVQAPAGYQPMPGGGYVNPITGEVK